MASGSESKSERVPVLSVADATTAVRDIVKELRSEKVKAKLSAIRESKRRVDTKVAQSLGVLFEVQGHVMKRYNFEGDDNGFDLWAAALKACEAAKSAEFEAATAELKTVQNEVMKFEQNENEEGKEEDEDEELEEEDGEGDEDGEDAEAEAANEKSDGKR